MYKLKKTDYIKVLSLLHDLKEECVFAHAVLENIQYGHIYVDDISNPKCCLIVSKGGKYFVAGDEEDLNFREFICSYLKNKSNHSNYFDLYVSSEKWLKIINELLEGCVVNLWRSIYCYNSKENYKTNTLKFKIPEGFVLKKMDEYLYDKYVREIDQSYCDIWGSAKKFIENGFGFCVLCNNEFVSTCNTCYVGGGCAEIDIMTNSKYRGKGFASITCSAFIEYCLEHELIPTWDADGGNEASNKLALKLGFAKSKDVNILWWHEDEEMIKSYLKKYNYLSITSS